MLNNSVFLSRVFSFTFNRHCQGRHNADYDVCRHWACRVVFWLEKWVWYGGEVG